MKKLYNLAAIAFALVLFCSASIAQRTITGTVLDAGGEALIGANVLEKGTNNGTITDLDGSYSVSVADGATLVFSFTGFNTQEVAVGSSNTIDITLEAGEYLDEVVVVGYGTLNAKEVTSSVASVKAEDFAKGNITNAAQLLQGRVAGVSVSKPSGDPNGNVQIRLRGLSSVGANATPLIIVDGVPGVNLNSVDPNDIESMDVLKDGSAAAIYGTRGAAGVILITTKKGKAGTSNISYNTFVTSDKAARFVNMMDAAEYRSYINNLPNGATAQLVDLGQNTDWFDLITRNAISHTHNLSLNGGTEKTSYNASFNYRDNQGVAINTGFEQLNGRLNLQQKAMDDKLTVSLNYTMTNRDETAIDPNAFRYASVYNPTSPVFDDNNPQYGGYYEEIKFDYFNPLSIAEQTQLERQQKTTVLSAKADYEIMEGLKVAAFVSQERNNFFAGSFSPTTQLFGAQGRGQAGRRNDENQSNLLELTANYNVEVADNTVLKLLGGYSYQDFTFQGLSASAGGFLSDALSFNRIQAASDWQAGLTQANTYKNANRLIAFFGRANLNFDDTYYLTASVRREGSTRFGDGNKWGIFPGLSAGVDLAKVLGSSTFDNLKLRAGYGVTGAQPNTSGLSQLLITSTGSSFYNNGEYVQSFAPQRNGNPNLQWEEKTDVTIGLDFAFGNYKWSGSLDYYNTITDNLILNFAVPQPPNLAPNTTRNVGELKNSGVELLLNYEAVTNENFSWKPTLTATLYTDIRLNSLTDAGDGVQDIANLGSPGQNQTPLIRVENGAPLGQIWGVKFVEYDSEGNLVFEDAGAVDGDLDDEAANRQVIGSGTPDFELGLNNNFTFGNWDANIFFRAVVGHDKVNTFRAFYEAAQAGASYNLYATTPENAATYIGDPRFSSLHVENASFLRLENFEIGYNLPMGDNSKFSSARFFVNGNNLLTFTGYDGVTPDVAWDDNGNLLAPGIDRRNTYFATRSFSVGLNLGF